MINAIWKDKIVSLGTADSVEYRILKDGAEIYRGKAYKRPGATNNEVKVNDIFADYITSKTPSFTSEVTSEILPTFTIQKLNGTSWTSVGTYIYINDWSYESRAIGNNISNPITKRAVNRQNVLVSIMSSNSAILYLNYLDGDTEVQQISSGTSGVESNGFIVRINLGLYPGLESITIGDYVYEVVASANKYVLHYRNAFGGWDSFLLEGNCIQEDDTKRTAMDVEYDNNVAANTGKKVVKSEIEKSITLKTGWLTDEESKQMHHLLNSPQVFLEDTETRVVLPVQIDDTKQQVKSFRNQGRQMVSYEMSATISRNYTRR